MNKRVTGTIYEDRAVEYLKKQGFNIVCRNFRYSGGEIDIIAYDKDTLVFIEVKYRSGKTYGSALEAVTTAKQNVIRKTAAYYLTTKLHRADILCRFDVIAFDGDIITHLRNAF